MTASERYRVASARARHSELCYASITAYVPNLTRDAEVLARFKVHVYDIHGRFTVHTGMLLQGRQGPYAVPMPIGVTSGHRLALSWPIALGRLIEDAALQFERRGRAQW